MEWLKISISWPMKIIINHLYNLKQDILKLVLQGGPRTKTTSTIQTSRLMWPLLKDMNMHIIQTTFKSNYYNLQQQQHTHTHTNTNKSRITKTLPDRNCTYQVIASVITTHVPGYQHASQCFIILRRIWPHRWWRRNQLRKHQGNVSCLFQWSTGHVR